MKSVTFIDIPFLLRHVPTLESVKKGRRTWDQLGSKVATDLLSQRPIAYHSDLLDKGLTLQIDTWIEAKKVIHAVMGTSDLSFAPIRKRLGNLENPSTPLIMSTLSLWLAGRLRISVSATRQMLGAMLFAVAKNSSGWEILRPSVTPSDFDPFILGKALDILEPLAV